MTPELVARLAVGPALELLGRRFDSKDAERMLIAIGLQESRLVHRAQIGGPARGYWQFERGGIRGVLQHPASQAPASVFCSQLDYQVQEDVIYGALQHNDILAAGFARLLLFTDSKPLPISTGDGWAYYVRNWRPGKPHIETWADCWSRASVTVG